MRRMIFAILLLGSLAGCVYDVNYPENSDYYVTGAYQHGGTYIGAGYWNYPGYGYGFYEPICGYNHLGMPLRCGGPVAPSYLRDIGVLPRPYLYYPYRRR